MMKNLYQILGLTQEASLGDIKKAYRRLALEVHPDKNPNKADSTEIMGLLNEAYAVLSDADKRRDFDRRWGTYQEAGIDLDAEIEVAGHLEAGPTPPYSQSFREQHTAMVVQFAETPLETVAASRAFRPFESGIYKLDEQDADAPVYHDVFTFVNEKTARLAGTSVAARPFGDALNPMFAVRIFLDFLTRAAEISGACPRDG